MTKAIYEDIERRFCSRMAELKLNPKSVGYRKAQTEFFMGAMAAMVAMKIMDCDEFKALTTGEQEDVFHGKCMPPRWMFSIMRGDNIVEEKETV